MKKIVFYDTETSGMPLWKEPSGSPDQPHIVQLAAILCAEETGNILAAIDLIVKPDGWEISEETTAVHGITQEHAELFGVPESVAVEMLFAMCDGAERAAYNKTFDQRIIRMALKRFMGEEHCEKWAIKEDHHDPMRMHQKVYGGKVVKLAESYLKATGSELQDAHSAMADTLAAKDVYYSLRGHEALES